MRRAWIVILGVAAALSLAACAPAGDEREIRVAAAASLQGAFDEIVAAFEEAHPGVRVAPVVYDGSSTLATQIAEGAPIDVAAFADERTMERIADQVDEPRIFATNSLVIAVPEGTDRVATLDDLADDPLDVVACAPEVPCGAATQEALDAAGVDLVAASLEQNVTAVARKVATGVADAGIVYRTDAAATAGIAAVEDPRLDEVVNRYPIAAVAAAGDDARAFVDYVLAGDAQEELAQWGFGAP
ncbi:molybdate ABC transporter substrate-binding protein [Microbacterium karelineae]|uniref:molybdate ABC transporter substrate-binding protein n=1 Tax=Microbacterium karelineae TaxID=2654283 RepID=UPI0012EA5237|nr:molybdate ABC transporter substrate-binding protein [Microbacterium karelineae]